MQIIYFLAETNESQVSLEYLQSLGLGYAFDSTPAVRGVLAGGIDGKHGVVIGRETAGVGYHPDRQKWEPMAGQPGVWIGIDTRNKPTPREMVRPSWLNPNFDNDQIANSSLLCIESHPLVTDDYVWPIPVARAWSMNENELAWGKTLPRAIKYGVDENGNKGFLPGETISKFLRIEEIAELVWEEWQNECIPDNFFELASEILGIPYYIGPQEMAMMQLVTMEPLSVAGLLWLVIDDPGFHEMSQKKIAAEMSAGGSGNAG